MATKDPAFLFYSKDFYEGTRLMLPEERACLIDLMIYQHQNGGIPNDIKRLSLYCSGINEDYIKSTLEQKFKLINNEWYSDKMSEVTSERSKKAQQNKLIGTFGYVLKKLNLNKKTELELRKRFKVKELLKKHSEWDSERLTEWCNNAIAVIEDANANNINTNNKLSIKERKQLFFQSISEKVKGTKYENCKDMLNEFYSYWTEHGDGDKKMKFEKKDSFSIVRRLSTWAKNDFNNNSKPNNSPRRKLLGDE